MASKKKAKQNLLYKRYRVGVNSDSYLLLTEEERKTMVDIIETAYIRERVEFYGVDIGNYDSRFFAELTVVEYTVNN